MKERRCQRHHAVGKGRCITTMTAEYVAAFSLGLPVMIACMRALNEIEQERTNNRKKNEGKDIAISKSL
jgi:hypothetical protein